MAINDDITLSKGDFTVTLFTTTSAENFKNTFKILPGVVTPDNQGSGVKKATVVDLLRITHSFSIECYITATSSKTAKQVKEDLIDIFNGGEVSSTPVVFTYEDTAFDVFIEDCVIKKLNNDDVVATGYDGEDAAEYQVTLSLVEGKLVGS